MSNRFGYLIRNGALSGARYVASPNFDSRPASVNIDLLVVHCISLPPGQYGGDAIERFFQNRLPANEHPYFESIVQLKVSAHLLIKRSGETLQFVNFENRAWHAGASCFEGVERCNDNSIGIELEGLDDQSYEPVQYTVLAKLTRLLMEEYPGITAERIVGHEDVSPGRKADPGPKFDWDYYKKLLEEIREKP